MARLRVDFSDVESFAVVPAGTYPVVVSEVQLRESGNSDHPYINWRLEITEGEFEGRNLWLMTSLSPKALWRLKEVFENLDVYSDEIELEVDEETNQMIAPELVGLPALAQVRIEAYQGR